jgi:hypothetical protein
MSAEQWVVVRNWERFQHYSDRSPTWIKSYTAQLHDPDYLGLSSHCRAVLEGVRLAYASSNGQLLLNTRSLSAQLALRVMSRDLESLIRAGFIEVSASRPLALRYPREETETEKRQKKKDPPTPLREEGGSRANGTNPRAVAQRSKVDRHDAMIEETRIRSEGWEETRTDLLHERLDEIERDYGATFSDQERDDLIDAHLERVLSAK